MELQIPVIVKAEDGQQYIRCVKCKNDKLKRDFRHTLMGRTFKKCFACTIQGIQRNEHKNIDKVKQREKQKAYYQSIKGKEARDKWKNKENTCPICKLNFKNGKIYNHFTICKQIYTRDCCCD